MQNQEKENKMGHSRELKFRAWEKKNRIMRLWDYLRNINYTKQFALFDDSDFVWMQYTGLKDKNGKEIYEGDIIQGDANVYGTKKWNKVVKYSDGSFNIDQAEGDLIEAIGNIYESEHLLDNTDMKV